MDSHLLGDRSFGSDVTLSSDQASGSGLQINSYGCFRIHEDHSTWTVKAVIGAQCNGKSCPRYAVIDSRGTGEPHGLLSPPGLKFAVTWKRLHPGRSVQFVSNPYPAAGSIVNFIELILTGFNRSYYNSVRHGVSFLQTYIRSYAAQCPQTRILLTGYSQGAHVTADTFTTGNTRSNVLGVALFGDPYFNSLDGSVDGGDYKIGENGALGIRNFFADYAWYTDQRVRSYCHAADPVCQGAHYYRLYGMTQHNTYDKLSEPEAAAVTFNLFEASRFG